MCRIAGIIDFQVLPSEEAINRMTNAMQHGGPDDNGVYIDEKWPLAFGHRRLSLIDLSLLAHQPMMDDDQQLIVIYNGEIYNFLEIRKELEQKKYAFKSTSDTEVVLYAYKEWGTACFQKFNGMFALAILDKANQKIVLARDHAGIKPLYYSLQNNQLIFASEIRAFKALKPDWEENKDWKKYFLLFGHLPEPITTLKDVQPVEKGTFLEISLPSLQTTKQCFYTPHYNYTIYNEADAVEKLRDTLTKAVERHLISDAPIGLFLSGGIDSSLLTLLAKPVVGNNLQTLSIVFDNDRFSEKKYQDIIIAKTGAKHRSYLVAEDEFKNALPDILEAMDQPSCDGINAYFINKYAKESGLKAVLSGLGADELFGGYPSFATTNLMQMMGRMPHFVFAAAKLFPDDRRKKINFLQCKTALGSYLFNRGLFIPAQVAQLLDCSENEINQLLHSLVLPDYIDGLHPLEKVSYFETDWYMQNQLLKDTDCMSMWHSVEVRVPFLDKDLMELAYAIAPEIRYNNKQKKHLLIKAFENELPRAIWDRPKQGFTFPFENWMKNVRLNIAADDVKTSKLYRGLFNGNTHWSRYWTYTLTQQYQ
jgi:asparagine synthase (glutamine-hydrolysing)